jgi:hypothetical protein
MTRQQIFTKVKNHLLSQNAKAMGKYGTCMYRTAEGLKCAVGCLIPDYEYDRRIEYKIVENLCDGGIKEFTFLKDFDKNFLRRLQVIHDNVDVKDWEKELKAFATLENLVYDNDNSNIPPPEAA